MKREVKITLVFMLIISAFLCFYSASAEIVSVTLNHPDNETVVNTTQPSLNFTAVSSTNMTLDNCTLYINDTDYGVWLGVVENDTEYSVIPTPAISGSDGLYLWDVECNDGHGAVNSTKRNFILDTPAPTYSGNITNSTSAGQIIKFSLLWQGTYNLSGYVFSLDNGNETFVNDSFVRFSGLENWSNASKLVNSSVGATIRWKIYANDTRGNWNVSDEYSLNLTDGTEPVSYISAPANSYNDSDGSINFSFRCTDNYNVSTIEFLTNVTGDWIVNYSNSSYQNNTWINLTLTGIPEKRNYKWAVYCNDTSGNSNLTGNLTFNVDKTDPDITDSSPDNHASYTLPSSGSKTVTFSYTVEDNLGIKNCSLYIDDSKKETNNSVRNDTEGTFQHSFDVEGDYDWKIICFDYAGNSDDVIKIVTINAASGSSNSGGSDNTDDVENQSIGSITSSKKVTNLDKGAKATFSVSGTTHSIIVKNISSYSAFLELGSTPIIFSAEVGVPRTFDLNGNGKDDFSVNLTGVNSEAVNMTLSVISEQGSNLNITSGNVTQNNVTGNFTSSSHSISISPESWKWIALAMTIIAIAFAAATGIAVQRKRKKAWWKKGH